MAIASAKAAPSNIGTNNLPADSGLRPIASMAFETNIPMAKAGAKPPTAMVMPLAKAKIDACSIYFFLMIPHRLRGDGFYLAE